MSFVKRRSEAASLPAIERDQSRCYANGCPFRGTSDLGGSGRFMCICHRGKDSRDWPAITERCNEFSWLGDFIGDVLRLSGEWTRGQHWSVFATEFWREVEPECGPTDWEKKHAGLYAVRMMEELRWRCGATSKRPQPATEPVRNPARGNVLEVSGLAQLGA